MLLLYLAIQKRGPDRDARFPARTPAPWFSRGEGAGSSAAAPGRPAGCGAAIGTNLFKCPRIEMEYPASLN